MRVVFCSDRTFALPTGVALYSLLANHPGRTLEIALFVVNLDPADLRRFETLCRDFGARLDVREIDETPFKGLPGTYRLPLGTYFRLLMPELLGPDVPKALYLDGDVIIDGDLTPLWQSDLRDVGLAACRDLGAQYSRPAVLGLSPTHEYFNAGVLLANLDVWRGESVAERALEFLRVDGQKASYLDQDALNVVLQDRVLYLSCVWNFMPYMKGTRFQEDFPAIEFGELKPRVIHFAGDVKPWAKNAPDDLYVRAWHDYRARSPWAEFGIAP